MTRTESDIIQKNSIEINKRLKSTLFYAFFFLDEIFEFQEEFEEFYQFFVQLQEVHLLFDVSSCMRVYYYLLIGLFRCY
jgi:hypothetical protein